VGTSIIPTVKLEGSRYGLTAIAHLRWSRLSQLSRLFDFGNLCRVRLSAGLYQNTTTSTEPGNPIRCIHVWRMDHNRRRPRYTDDGRATNMVGRRLDQRVLPTQRILTDTYAFGRIGTSVYDGTDTAAHGCISSTTAVERAIDSVVETIGCPICLRRQVHRRRHRAPVGWSITSGGHHLAILEHVHPLGRQGGHEPILRHSRPSPTLTSTQVHPSA
jgi:hypothetical protein